MQSKLQYLQKARHFILDKYEIESIEKKCFLNIDLIFASMFHYHF